MRKILLVFLCVNTFINCQSVSKDTFSEEALNDQFISLNGDSISFKSILDKHAGKEILIDVWASWCKDCIESFPKLKELQKSYPKLDYVFLSLDKSKSKWLKGIDHYKLTGEHYFMSSGRKGPMGKFLNLNWIPRFLLVNSTGQIVVFNAIKPYDKNLLINLK